MIRQSKLNIENNGKTHLHMFCVGFVIFSTVNWDGINIEIKDGKKTLTKKIILYRAARPKNMLCILSVKVPPAPPSLPLYM